jgi:putative NADH-flavin reductase
MKITIFGATGKTGQHLVQQALEAGHNVTAFARTPSKLSINHAQLSVIEGDIQDEIKVEEAVAGADAVISVLGPTRGAREYAVTNGTKHMLAAMKKHNVRRLVISAGAGVGDSKDKPLLMNRVIDIVLRLISPKAVEDMTQVANTVRMSAVEWVIVRVPMLTDDPAGHHIKVGYVGKDMGYRLSRADMAAFMLKQTQDDTYLRQAPVISN